MADYSLDLDSTIVKETINKFSDLVRIEKSDVNSYYDIYAEPSILKRLVNNTNQIIYGRRGTGKSHLLLALQEMLINKDLSKVKALPIYIDLRTVLPILTEYGPNKVETSILIFKFIIESIIEGIISNVKNVLESEDFFITASEKYLIEQLQQVCEELNVEFNGKTFKKLGSISLSKEEISKISGSLKVSSQPEIVAGSEKQVKDNSSENLVKYVSFSQISQCLAQLPRLLDNHRIFCLLDEWSEIPISLQPYVAELLKRSFITTNYVLKIAAIPYRSRLNEVINDEMKIGLEEGGDIFIIPLDNRCIFEIDKTQTKNFYNELLYKHLLSINPNLIDNYNLKQQEEIKRTFLNQFFANQALSEILIASAGVPRDFINLFINSFNENSSGSRRISIRDVRYATSRWYNSDKREEVEKDSVIKKLYEGIVDEIIKKRKRTHFLIPKHLSENRYIKKLIDLRVLHLRKDGISHRHIPDKSYNVYSVDYGSYTSMDIAKKNLDSDFDSFIEGITTSDNLREARSYSLEDDFFDRFLLNIGEGVVCKHCSKAIDINHLAYKKQNMCYHCYEIQTK